jgi:hypothetical protein
VDTLPALSGERRVHPGAIRFGWRPSGLLLEDVE